MDKHEKVKFVADLHDLLEKAQGVFIVEYKGLDVEAMNSLRTEFKKINAEFQVVKNRLLKLACQGTESESIKDYMQGPSAIALTYDDVIAPAKVLINFAGANERLKVKGGQISGRMLDAPDLKRLAELPEKDVLMAQVLAAMQAVPASFVRVLNQVMANLLNVLSAIELQKEESMS